LSPAAILDAETTRVLRVAGSLVAMLVLKRIRRSVVEAAASDLARAADNLRGMLELC